MLCRNNFIRANRGRNRTAWRQAAEARERDRKLVRDIEATSAAQISRTVVPPPSERGDASVSAFVLEQRRKNEEIDRLRRIERESLKSLNSPLPSPGRPAVGMPPSPYRAPPPVPVPAAASARSSPSLSLADLTMAKKDRDGGGGTPSLPPAPSSPQPLNLFDMAKLKQDSGTSNSNVNAKKPSAKRTVRQQLPLSTQAILGDGEDDEDDDNLMRSGAPGLTVADALKQQRKESGSRPKPPPVAKKNIDADSKAKQWGIDMGKFT